MTMTEYENIMNSGKLYKVMELTNQDPQYHDYLQQMENYNQLGYSPEEEMEKHEILKKKYRCITSSIAKTSGKGLWLQQTCPYW